MRATIIAIALSTVCSAAPCVQDTMTAYGLLGPGGCDIGTEYIVRDFNYLLAAVNAGTIDADDVIVTPSLQDGAPVLTFSANWLASGIASSYTGLIEFTVESVGPQLRAFTGNTLTTDHAVSGLAGNAEILEVNCLGGALPDSLSATTPLTGVGCLGGGVTANLGTFANILTSDLSADITFAPVFEIDVVKQFTLLGALGGTASMSSITQSFDVTEGVPEPSTIGLAGAALIVLAVRKRVRQ